MLHERYAPSPEVFDVVWKHCAIVCEIAERIMDGAGLDLDRDLVRAGCLLHDIGVYELYDATGQLDHTSYILHGVLGHEILRHEGLPEVIRRFCSRHTGVGLTRDDIERQRLPLPLDDYVAESLEEWLVMYADKFHSKTNPPVFVSAESYAAHVRRFGEDKVTIFKSMREYFGEPELGPIADRHGHALV
ncbi:HD domain-containing protein [Actinomadura meridiana]|uniref:HD domain-containing protein n=1 Tax=Actinomadura meridiana TaxID=559626 RepID=A0ABP8BZE9_9ACTN